MEILSVKMNASEQSYTKAMTSFALLNSQLSYVVTLLNCTLCMHRHGKHQSEKWTPKIHVLYDEFGVYTHNTSTVFWNNMQCKRLKHHAKVAKTHHLLGGPMWSLERNIWHNPNPNKWHGRLRGWHFRKRLQGPLYTRSQGREILGPFFWRSSQPHVLSSLAPRPLVDPPIHEDSFSALGGIPRLTFNGLKYSFNCWPWFLV